MTALKTWFSYYCETHDALSIIWNCYCGKQNEEVVVKIFRKEKVVVDKSGTGRGDQTS